MLSHLHLQQATPSAPDQPDRISELSDEILCKILSLMPMQMSVQTGVLSKRWLHFWKRTQVVDFHTLPFSPWKPVDYSSITRCLDSLESPNFPSFTVVGHVGYNSHPDVRRWVEFALSKNVHTLIIGLMEISFPIDFKFSPLPSSFFSKGKTQKLEVLLLSCVDFTPPPGITFSGFGFVSLKSLSLKNCNLADSTVELLLLKCPVLEVLVLDDCPGLRRVNIRGPNLKLKQLTFRWYFFDDVQDFPHLNVDVPGLSTLKYHGDLTHLRLKNCEGLEKIILVGYREIIDQEIADHIRELLNQIFHVKILGLNSLFLQLLERDYYRRGIPFLKFQNLEHLIWFHLLESENQVYNLVSFIADCPSLRTFEIDHRWICWSSFFETLWESDVERKFVMVKEAKYHGRYLENLKSVRLICFSGRQDQMMLVRLLLEKAVNLQKLEILWETHPSNMNDNVLQIIIKHRLKKLYSGPALGWYRHCCFEQLLTRKDWGDLTKLHLKKCEGSEKIFLHGMLEDMNRRTANHIGELVNQVIHVKIMVGNYQLLQEKKMKWMLVKLLLTDDVNLEKLEMLWEAHPNNMTDNVLADCHQEWFP
ncbi:hypothetical protein DITRI_Ditri07aG0153000 [Diplodiscus trichospermus]